MTKRLVPAVFFGMVIACNVWSGPLEAATLVYSGPGGSPAPCDTTLQACIDGAASGDTIEIATDARIDENLVIAKSLTLASAEGFNALIGSANAATPRDIDVNDAGIAGGSVSIVLRGLRLDAARVMTNFNEDTGHAFEMSDCDLAFSTGNNNDAGLDVDATVSSSFVIQDNRMSTPGQPIQFDPSPIAGATVTGLVQRNLLTTPDSPNSHEGIEIRPGGNGTVSLRVLNNVIHGISGCNCGAESVLDVEISGAVTANVDILNNTIDDVPGTGNGLLVGTPGGTSVLTLNLFNNTFSNIAGNATDMPIPFARFALNADANNFFNVGAQDPDYPAGPNDVAAEPLFRDASAADYHLSAGSALIDAGISEGLTLPDTDFDGRARIIGAAVDIGAHEASADVSVSNVDSPDPFDLSAGGDITYMIRVENGGPDAAAAVVLTDTLAPGTAFVSGTFEGGVCAESSGTVTCDLGAIASGAGTTVTLLATPSAEGELANTASVTGSVPDPDASNNSATAVTTVEAGEDGTEGDDENEGGGGCSLLR